jgi:thiosulfate/3-mercaptopyruvate sulfurtransferase
MLFLIAPGAVSQVRTGPRDVPKMNSDMVVSTKWVAENLQNPLVVVLHVGKDRSVYDAGHIPGARFLALDEIVVSTPTGDNELPPTPQIARKFSDFGIGDNTRVALYGDHLGLYAARAYFTLDYLGAGNRAALIDGGLEKWKEERRALSKDEGARAKPAQFTPHVNPKVLADMAKVEEVSRSLAKPAYADTALVDSRPDADFTSLGHIPGAVSVFWTRNLESEQDPSLPPPFELRTMYEELGVTRDKRVITYCRTGVQASYSYFILKWLGYDVALYDGSYQNWSKNH